MTRAGVLGLAITGIAAGAAVGAGVYDPQPGAYSPEQDPKTVVHVGVGVGDARFGQPIAEVPARHFGPVRRRALLAPAPGRPRGWLVRSYGGVQIAARMDGRKRITAFVLRSPGFRTRQGFGIGDSLAGARTLFGPARRVSSDPTGAIWRFTRPPGTVLVRTNNRQRVLRWAITRDGALRPKALLGP